MTSLARPLVGVTGPTRGGAAAWAMTRLAILRAGGRAIRITPRRPRHGVALDALVLGGGADIDPSEWAGDAASSASAAPLPGALADESILHAARIAAAGSRAGAVPSSTRFWAPFVLALRRVLAVRPSDLLFRGVDRERDRLERRLLVDADARNLPILGICRGAQLLNVFYGGSLHADIEALYVEHPYIRTVLPRKRVQAEPESRLASIVGRSTILVNALHHQAVERVGKGMRVVARDATGVVQAIERPGERLCLGVQWHPEYIPQQRAQRLLFEALVHAARAATPLQRGARRATLAG